MHHHSFFTGHDLNGICIRGENCSLGSGYYMSLLLSGHSLGSGSGQRCACFEKVCCETILFCSPGTGCGFLPSLVCIHYKGGEGRVRRECALMWRNLGGSTLTKALGSALTAVRWHDLICHLCPTGKATHQHTGHSSSFPQAW